MIKTYIETFLALSEVRYFCMYCHEKTASALPTTNHRLSATKGDTLKSYMFKIMSFLQAEKQT